MTQPESQLGGSTPATALEAWLRLIVRRYDDLRAAEEREFGQNVNVDWGGRCGREMNALFIVIARAKHSLEMKGSEINDPLRDAADAFREEGPLLDDESADDVVNWLRLRARL